MSGAAQLERRPLGTTGFDVSVLGFGSWAAGGGDYVFGLGSQRDDDSIAAIRAAVDVGMNWIDTAPVYGFGHSESIVGRALQAIPQEDRPYVVTKCGLVQISPDRSEPPIRSLKPESIRTECVASLQRLGVDCIDVYLFHWPDLEGTPVEESWEAMQSLISEGLVRSAGVSNFSIDDMERCERIAPISVVQPPLSLLRTGSLSDVIPWCRERNIGVIIYSPMQSGMLTGTLTRDDVLRMAQDWRSQSPEVHDPLAAHCIDAQPALRSIGQELGVFGGAVAIAWTLAQDGVSGAIVGARSADHVIDLVRAGDIELSDTHMERLERAFAAFAQNAPPSPV